MSDCLDHHVQVAEAQAKGDYGAVHGGCGHQFQLEFDIQDSLQSSQQHRELCSPREGWSLAGPPLSYKHVITWLKHNSSDTMIIVFFSFCRGTLAIFRGNLMCLLHLWSLLLHIFMMGFSLWLRFKVKEQING